LAFNGFAQKQPQFTEEDAKQFYRTIQGDYVVADTDSTTMMVHFTPIWETPENRFQWLYLEAVKNEKVVLQKVLELQPKSERIYKVIVHDLKNPEQFVGRWGNRNFFDGFTPSILSKCGKMTFVKTADFSYQSNDGSIGFKRYKMFECFPKGDLLHFKFVQQDERFYIKRMPQGTNQILGYQGLKELTD
jgi:hypothetical protein